jgi:hypothetical protein
MTTMFTLRSVCLTRSQPCPEPVKATITRRTLPPRQEPQIPTSNAETEKLHGRGARMRSGDWESREWDWSPALVGAARPISNNSRSRP